MPTSGPFREHRHKYVCVRTFENPPVRSRQIGRTYRGHDIHDISWMPTIFRGSSAGNRPLTHVRANMAVVPELIKWASTTGAWAANSGRVLP